MLNMHAKVYQASVEYAQVEMDICYTIVSKFQWLFVILTIFYAYLV